MHSKLMVLIWRTYSSKLDKKYINKGRGTGGHLSHPLRQKIAKTHLIDFEGKSMGQIIHLLKSRPLKIHYRYFMLT